MSDDRDDHDEAYDVWTVWQLVCGLVVLLLMMGGAVALITWAVVVLT